MMTPAERVYLALVLRETDPVEARLDDLVVECDLSESQVRRALRRLREDGLISPSSKRGTTTLWRLNDAPGTAAAAESSDRQDPIGGLTVPTGFAASPPSSSPADPEPSDEEVAEMRRLGLAHLDAWLDQHDAEIGDPDQPEGECGECGGWARRRWSLGLFVLCRDCRRRRARVALKVAVEAVGQSAVTGAAQTPDSAQPLRDASEPVPPRRELALVEPPTDDGLWEQPNF
jgi:DNA-binding transcriptional ArsR family regulator